MALEDKEFENMIPIYTTAMMSKDHEAGIEDQKSHKAVAESPLAAKHYTAMKEELDAIDQHRNFENVVEFLEARKAFSSYWVYKIERNGPDHIQRFKARLVYEQINNIQDTNDWAMNAATTRFRHIRLALSIISKCDLEIQQLDVCTAFLGVHWAEVIYLPQLQG